MPTVCPDCHNPMEDPKDGAKEVVCEACGSIFTPSEQATKEMSQLGLNWVRGPTPGQAVSHYMVTEKLGSGGMGVVYKAQDTRLGRFVAVKFLPERLARNSQAIERFRREARTASALNHPNICTVFDVGEHDGQPFLVMELLEGTPFRQYLAGKPLPVDEVLELSLQAADALDAAHAKGIIHRDIKPANMFLTQRGQLKVLDFGLAKLISSAETPQPEPSVAQADLSVAGLVLGTVRYMSPEQARGEELDPRSDLFSLGAVLYEMATGHAAFATGARAVTLAAILNQEPVLPRQRNAAVPVELEHIINKALEKDRELRYQRASELRTDLKRLKRDTDSGRTALVPIPAQRPATRSPRVRRAVLGGMALIAAIVAGAFLWQFRGQPPKRADADAAAPAVEPSPGILSTPFLVGASRYEQPAWSPAGNLIAYVSDESGNEDIWICDANGGRHVNITAGSNGVNAHPAWSPDGQRIAFFSERDGGGIYITTALGGEARRLVRISPGVLYTFSLSWARNGQLLYTDFDAAGKKQVYRVSEANPVPESLTADLTPSPGAQFGELSPSGNLFLFLGPQLALVAPLYMADLRTKTVRTLETSAGKPHWGPRGDRVFFLSSRRSLPELWSVPVDPESGVRTGRTERLVPDVDDYAVSSDGRKLLTVRSKRQSRLWSLPVQASALADLSAGQPLASGGLADGNPSWSHDEESILFVSRRRGVQDLWRLPLGASRPVRLTTGSADCFNPLESPDGHWLAYAVADKDETKAMIARPDGSEAHDLGSTSTEPFRLLRSGSWSADSQRLTCELTTRDGKETVGIATMDRVTGRTSSVRLIPEPPPGVPCCPRWSPDGRLIVYETVSGKSWNLWITDGQGRQPRRLTSEPANERTPVWSTDGKFVYFVKDNRSIWRIPMGADGATGQPACWAKFPKTQIDVDAVAVGKRRAIVAITEENSELWLVEFAPP